MPRSLLRGGSLLWKWDVASSSPIKGEGEPFRVWLTSSAGQRYVFFTSSQNDNSSDPMQKTAHRLDCAPNIP
jgi:hypothetical protein